MTKSALSAIVGLSLSASSVLTMDWNLKSQLGETVEVSDNYFLRSPPSGTLYVPTSTLGVDAIGRTPTMRFAINSSVNYRAYGGPGATGLLNALGTSNHIGIEKTDHLTTYNVGASYSTQEVAAAQLTETGVVTGTGLVNTALVEGGLKRELSQTDTLSLSARATSNTFTASGSTPFTDVLTTSDWTHRVNRTTDLTNLLQFDRLSYDDAAKSQIMIARATQGVKSEISSRLTFKGAVGAVFTDATSNGTGNKSNLSNPFIVTPQTGGSSLDWIGDMNLTYKPSTATEFSALAAKTAGPTIIGQILTSDTFGATLHHNINELSSITLWSQYSLQTGANGTVNLLATSATYSCSPAPEWQAALTYTFRQLLTTGAMANTFIFSVTRNATILP
jgi:hypothetical protein